MILCVDPGIRGCGVALFDSDDRRLARCAYVKNPARSGGGPREAACMGAAVFNAVHEPARFVVVEWPQVYAQGKQKGDQADLLSLAAVDGAIVGAFGLSEAASVLPRVWKGQVPKEIMVSRILLRLTDGERGIFEACTREVPKSLRHNVVDAIGIGLFTVGRLIG